MLSYEMKASDSIALTEATSQGTLRPTFKSNRPIYNSSNKVVPESRRCLSWRFSLFLLYTHLTGPESRNDASTRIRRRGGQEAVGGVPGGVSALLGRH
jgi:hypothetical protein